MALQWVVVLPRGHFLIRPTLSRNWFILERLNWGGKVVLSCLFRLTHLPTLKPAWFYRFYAACVIVLFVHRFYVGIYSSIFCKKSFAINRFQTPLHFIVLLSMLLHGTLTYNVRGSITLWLVSSFSAETQLSVARLQQICS